MSTVVELSLVLLIFVVIAATIVVSVYLVKLLIELNVLTKNANDTTTIVKNELEPILTELKQTMTSINTIAQNADNQMATVKKVIASAVGLSSVLFGSFGKVSGGFMKGFSSAFNLFRKK